MYFDLLSVIFLYCDNFTKCMLRVITRETLQLKQRLDVQSLMRTDTRHLNEDHIKSIFTFYLVDVRQYCITHKSNIYFMFINNFAAFKMIMNMKFRDDALTQYRNQHDEERFRRYIRSRGKTIKSYILSNLPQYIL